MWCTEPGKQGCLISRDLIFNEEEMPLKSQDFNSEEKKSKQTRTEVELDQLHQDSRFNDTDEIEEDSTQDLTLQDYQLARDRERRQGKAPQIFGYADLIAYALSVTNEPTRN